MALDQALAVKVDEDIEGRIEDVAYFFRSQGALRQNLAEVLFGIFHDRIDERQIFQATAAGVEDGQQIRMSEMGRALPEAELIFGSRRAGGNQLEHGFFARGVPEFRQKYGVELCACKALPQHEFAFDR